MSITRARLTRYADAECPRHKFVMVFFEDDLDPPLCHVVTVYIDESELHNMRSAAALANALVERFQHDCQTVPGDRELIRAEIVKQVGGLFGG